MAPRLKTARELLGEAGLGIERTELIGSTPGGGPLRRSLVRRLRELTPLGTAQAFLFVTRPPA